MTQIGPWIIVKKAIIRWIIEVFLPGYHLHRDPEKKNNIEIVKAVQEAFGVLPNDLPLAGEIRAMVDEP